MTVPADPYRATGAIRGWRVSTTTQPGALPLRPLTVGELLDAAVSLLRVRGPLLIGWGVAAAALEQLLLFPYRRLADVNSFYYPADDRWAKWALLLVVGFAAEAAIIAALSWPAAAVAPRALLGGAAPGRESPGRPAAVTAAVAVAVGVACGAAVATALLWPTNALLLVLLLLTVALWLPTYGLLGHAVPAAVTERRGPVRALSRSLVLSSRWFLRGAWVRVLAYLGWLLVRIAWGLGMLQLISLVYASPDTTMDNVLMAGVYLVVNAFMYPVLACLDAVSYLEVRMRTEGLDIALRRHLARGDDPTPTLVGA